jgi:hypothetical protein
MTPDKRITLVGGVMAPAKIKDPQKLIFQACRGKLWLHDV